MINSQRLIAILLGRTEIQPGRQLSTVHGNSVNESSMFVTVPAQLIFHFSA